MANNPSNSEPSPVDTSTVPALRKLVICVGTLAVLALATYGSTALKRFRPWVPGEPPPLARLFHHYGGLTLPAFAEAGEMAAPAGSGQRESIEELGAAVAANLGPGAVGKPRTGSRRPARPGGGKAAGAAASRVGVDPEELEGLGQFIEDPEGRALAPFYEALLRTARGEPKAITRIAHYGDSTVAADSITRTMRRLMQTRFGDAGHGFILIAPGDMHYYHMDISHRFNDAWELHQIVLISLGKDWYGYGGVQFRGASGAWARFATVDEGDIGTRVSRFELFYQRYPGGGYLDVKLDGKPQNRLDTRGEQKEDAWAVFEATDGSHSLSIRAAGRGTVRLYGVAMERDVAGVVYDSLGIVGCRAERLLNAEQEHMRRQISHRAPNLLILAFGGNEADKWLNVSYYEAKLRQVVTHMRVEGQATACLLFAPLDQGERNERGQVRTIRTLPEIVEAQRRVARSENCAFFDTYSAMGGKNSIWRWYASRPRLATSDFRHATDAGYEVIGNMFYKAILKGFADYLESKGGSSSGAK